MLGQRNSNSWAISSTLKTERAASFDNRMNAWPDNCCWGKDSLTEAALSSRCTANRLARPELHETDRVIAVQQHRALKCSKTHRALSADLLLWIKLSLLGLFFYWGLSLFPLSNGFDKFFKQLKILY